MGRCIEGSSKEENITFEKAASSIGRKGFERCKIDQFLLWMWKAKEVPSSVSLLRGWWALSLLWADDILTVPEIKESWLDKEYEKMDLKNRFNWDLLTNAKGFYVCTDSRTLRIGESHMANGWLRNVPWFRDTHILTRICIYAVTEKTRSLKVDQASELPLLHQSMPLTATESIDQIQMLAWVNNEVDSYGDTSVWSGWGECARESACLCLCTHRSVH